MAAAPLGLALLLASACAPPPVEGDPSIELAATTMEDSEVVPVHGSPIYGNPNAPVTVMVFGTPAHRDQARSVENLQLQIVNGYEGAVRLVHRYFPMGTNPRSRRYDDQMSWAAAKALEAVRQQDEEAFWDLNLEILRHGPVFERTPEEIALAFVDGRGLDRERFERDFHAPETLGVIVSDRELGRQLGLSALPSILVNGVAVGVWSLSALVESVDRQLTLVKELRAEGINDEQLYAAAVERNLDESGRPVREMRTGDDRLPPVVRRAEVRPEDPVRDSEDALVTVIEFTSPVDCPRCLAAHRMLNIAVGEVGTPPEFAHHVRRVLKPSARTQDEAAPRALAAAQEQGKFWAMHEALFDHEQMFNGDPLDQVAERIGLDVERFRQDLESERTRQVVAQAGEDARAAGIRVLPTAVVNGVHVVGSREIMEFVAQQVEVARAIQKETGLSGEELHDAVVDHNLRNPPGYPDPR